MLNKANRFARVILPKNQFSQCAIGLQNRVARVNAAVQSAKQQQVLLPSRFYSSQAKEDMFCFQCEQTNNGTGCTTLGVCGKTPEVAALQDLLINNLKNMSVYTHLAHKNGVPMDMIRPFSDLVLRGLYSTLTNVNFDAQRFVDYLTECQEMTMEAKKLYESSTANPRKIEFEHAYDISKELQARDVPTLVAIAKSVGVQERLGQLGQFAGSMQELLTYGLKGYAAYAREAELLGQTDPEVFAFMNEAMAFLSGVPNVTEFDAHNGDHALALALKCGEVNIKVMSLLDKGANVRFGSPEPTQVSTTPEPGKCILVSGHDLGDLHAILEQTEGKGINVYTHGELLPGNSYPGLKKFKHLKGNYGGPWQLQQYDFSMFPGPIVMTTNCIIEPRKKYADRIFTTSEVGWPGVRHIKNHDFSEVVKSALENKGFPESVAKEEKKQLTIGFNHHTILSIAPSLVDAITKGQLQKVFVIGGCDGTEGERNFYKDLATSLPKDSTLMLTLGCAKYRINKYDHGTMDLVDPKTQQKITIPRLLDVGQCNDVYSALKVALALKEVTGVKDINDLPLAYAISWFEQKAVVIFLTMLHLGVKNMRIGPRLPAFLPPAVVKVLQEKLNLRAVPVPDVQSEMNAMIKGM